MLHLGYWKRGLSSISLLALLMPLAGQARGQSQLLVPGSGERLAQVGDDFEDPNWAYRFNPPKSTSNLDENTRNPTGSSLNGRWFEGALRGQPDIVQRVETPEGGLPGSTGALLLRSRDTGIPGRPSRQMQQDDFIVNVKQRIGGLIPVSWSPSCVVRVYLPPFEQWEDRTGNSFAFRAGCWGPGKKSDQEEFWPGLFIYFYSSSDRRYPQDSAQLLIRSDERGRDIWGPKITETGWWTLGMSFTPDGRVHYFAHPGLEDLTAADHIASHTPYSMPCRYFETFFFNVVSADNGRTWSTPWVIDDANLYSLRSNFARRSR